MSGDAARLSTADGGDAAWPGVGSANHLNDADLVIATRAGDREALDLIVRRYLPMVYNLVRRSMDGDAHTDDVVQDIMLRAMRQLPELRDPPHFRPWLVAISIDEINTHVSRERTASCRVSRLDEAVGRPDPAAEVEGPTLLRADLAAQVRQVQHASRWLTDQDRMLLGLWYMESVGQLTRDDVARVLSVKIPHAAVRLQRMRAQLDLSRAVVAALDAVPGCALLGDVVEYWDGVPSPYWRKRIGRHVRSCAGCSRTEDGRVPADRLLVGIVMLPVPIALAAVVVTRTALVGKGATATATAGSATEAGGWALSRFLQMAVAHPVASTIAAGTLALGVTAGATGSSIVAPLWPGGGPPSSQPLAAGALSLEAADATGQFVTASGDQAALAPVGKDGQDRSRATFEAVPGLADRACFSFRTDDGRYLRHAGWQLWASRDDGTGLFGGDATFCARPGSSPGTVALESANFPGRFVRYARSSLRVEPGGGSDGSGPNSSFLIREPLA